jgi:hypothetical protein
MRVACLSHDDAKLIVAQVLIERKRPSSTIPRGLYDTASSRRSRSRQRRCWNAPR